MPRQDGAGDALRELRRGLAPPGEESAPSSVVWVPWDKLSFSLGSRWRHHPDLHWFHWKELIEHLKGRL